MHRFMKAESVSWNPHHWNADTWIALHGPILFSIVFNAVCLIYLYKIWRQRNCEEVAKHLDIRHNKLFYSHLFINYYWISIHPSVIFVCILLRIDTPLLFCFTYLIISIKLLIWCNRMWLLYWNYSFSSMQIKMLWKKHINNNYRSFLLNYPKLGRLSFTFIVTSIPMFIFDIFLFWIAYYTHFDESFHLSIAVHFFLWVLFLNFLCIRLHRKHNVDNFKIRSEFTWLCLLFSADFGILVTPYFIVSNQCIRIWIIIDGLALCNLIMIVITVELILNNANTRNERNIITNVKTKNIVSVLKHPVGINAFAEWLIGEFNVESLLFVIEVCQFRTLLKNNVLDHEFDDVATFYFEIADNIPLTQIIKECRVVNDTPDSTSIVLEMGETLDTNSKPNLSVYFNNFMKYNNYNFGDIAKRIYWKYVDDEESDLCINISYDQRMDLSKIDFEDIDTVSLYHVFDDVFVEMLRVLLDPFKRFAQSDTYKQWLNNQEITKSEFAFNEIKNSMDQRLHLLFHSIAICLENKCCNKCC